MPLPELRILLLDKAHLLLAQFHALFGHMLLQAQPAIVARAQPMLVQDVLHRWSRDREAFQSQRVTEEIAAPGGMLQADGQQTFNVLRRGVHRVRLRDRGQVFESFDAVPLEAALVLVERLAREAAAAAGFRDVAEGLGEFEDGEALVGELLFSVHVQTLHGGSGLNLALYGKMLKRTGDVPVGGGGRRRSGGTCGRWRLWRGCGSSRVGARCRSTSAGSR